MVSGYIFTIIRRRLMKNKTSLTLLCCAAALLLAAPGAFAHNLWLNPADQNPRVGETVDIGIGWGHKFPAGRTDEEVKENAVEEIKAFDPDGKPVDLVRESKSSFKLKVEKQGVYLVAARIKPGFFSMTPEGRKWGDKKEVPNADKCTSFNIDAKTLIVADGGDKNLSGLTNQPLEVVPLKDPGKLKKGDSLPIKVLFNGKPLAGLAVKAAYAGYEDPAEEKAEAGKGASEKGHKGGGHRYPVETVTDENGQAIIKVDTAGWWMANLSHKTPYPDAGVCDESMYNTAFTFSVK
jgi:uncharacterized GH25 family protein